MAFGCSKLLSLVALLLTPSLTQRNHNKLKEIKNKIMLVLSTCSFIFNLAMVYIYYKQKHYKGSAYFAFAAGFEACVAFSTLVLLYANK